MQVFLWVTFMYEFLASRVFNTPLLIQPGKLDVIADVLIKRMSGKALDEGFIKSEQQMINIGEGAQYKEAGYYVSDNIGVVDVFGSLVHRSSWLGAASGMTGYEGLAKKLDAMAKDPDVKAILMNVDSPGGEVAGAFDFADKVKQINAIKPIYALASDMMSSAAYLISANATKIIATQTAVIGSVGVVMRAMDMSAFDEKTGIKTTYIYSGDYKIDGNPHAPMSEDVKARFQADIDRIYNMFVDVVATGRNIERQDVIDTKAGTFIGRQAVVAGLADDVMSGEQLLATMKSQFSDNSINSFNAEQEKPIMAENEKDISADKAVDTEESQDNQPESSEENVKAERQRIAAITGCEDAKGREKLAQHLAFNTDMSADEAVAILAAAPSDSADASQSAFTNAMAKAEQEQPEVSDEEGKELNAEDQAVISALSNGVKKNIK